MRFVLRSILCLLLATLSLGCAPSYREGLPLNSPFAEPVSLRSDLLPQGFAVGDVTASGALVWVRTDGPATVQIEWAKPSVWEMAPKMATAVAPVARTPRMATSADSDFTAATPLQGLEPGTRYRYHVLVGRAAGPQDQTELVLAARGEFTTLPDEKTSAPVTFAWSGDLGGQQRCRLGADGYPIFDQMRRQGLDFFLFLGDTIYSDYTCPSPPNEPGADFIATTLAEYRVRHRYQRGALALRRFLETVPVYVVWDDHEVKNDFSGPFEAQMPDGRQALREYWPIASPSDDPQRLYRTVRYGADLELFILDGRQYRSRNTDPDGPGKTMLGERQLQWLLEGLRGSTATWKVIATSVPLSIPKGRGTTEHAALDLQVPAVESPRVSVLAACPVDVGQVVQGLLVLRVELGRAAVGLDRLGPVLESRVRRAEVEPGSGVPLVVRHGASRGFDGRAIVLLPQRLRARGIRLLRVDFVLPTAGGSPGDRDEQRGRDAPSPGATCPRLDHPRKIH